MATIRTQLHEIYYLPQISSKWLIFLGVLNIIIGTVAIFMPVIASVALEIFFGALFLVSGLFQIIYGFSANGATNKFFYILAGIIYLSLGGVLLYFIPEGLLALTIVFSVGFIVVGLFRFYVASQIPSGSGRIWHILGGIAALALAGIILYGLPTTALWVLGIILGVDLIFFGVNLLFQARLASEQPTS